MATRTTTAAYTLGFSPRRITSAIGRHLRRLTRRACEPCLRRRGAIARCKAPPYSPSPRLRRLTACLGGSGASWRDGGVQLVQAPRSQHVAPLGQPGGSYPVPCVSHDHDPHPAKDLAVERWQIVMDWVSTMLSQQDCTCKTAGRQHSGRSASPLCLDGFDSTSLSSAPHSVRRTTSPPLKRSGSSRDTPTGAWRWVRSTARFSSSRASTRAGRVHR